MIAYLTSRCSRDAIRMLCQRVVIRFRFGPRATLPLGIRLGLGEYQLQKQVRMAVRSVRTVVVWRLLGADAQGCMRKAKRFETALSIKANFLRGFFGRFH
jgi:hypothetical protein